MSTRWNRIDPLMCPRSRTTPMKWADQRNAVKAAATPTKTLQSVLVDLIAARLESTSQTMRGVHDHVAG